LEGQDPGRGNFIFGGGGIILDYSTPSQSAVFDWGFTLPGAALGCFFKGRSNGFDTAKCPRREGRVMALQSVRLRGTTRDHFDTLGITRSPPRHDGIGSAGAMCPTLLDCRKASFWEKSWLSLDGVRICLPWEFLVQFVARLLRLEGFASHPSYSILRSSS
jgi:hypothetical protein